MLRSQKVSTTAVRRLAFLFALSGVALACDVATVAAPQLVAEPSETIERDATAAQAAGFGVDALPSQLNFGTYDGSGQVVHPDVVSFPASWNGHRFWNAITPYPNSATRFENPSLFSSDDGDQWSVPTGVTNPLAKTGRGYLSDPDMVFEPNRGELWLYYREVENWKFKVKKDVHIADHVWLTMSSDAVHWSAPRRVASDTGKFVVSPSVVRTPDGAWRMYQVDAGREGCSAKSSRVLLRRSTDGVTWSAADAAGITQPGYVPWHLDVQYIPERGEFWALVAAYVSGQGCTTTSLFLLTSTDGSTWTSYPSPVLARGDVSQFSSAVYRSTLAYVSDDSVIIWYSGARIAKAASRKKAAVFAWSAAVTHTTAPALFARVNDKTRTASLSVTPGAGHMFAPATIAP